MFAASRVIKATGAHYREGYRLLHEFDLIDPAKKKGPRIHLSLWEALTFFILADLKRQGATVRKMREVMAEVREKRPGLWDSLVVERMNDEPRIYFLVSHPKRGASEVFVIDDEREIAHRLKEVEGGQLHLFDLKARAREMYDTLKSTYSTKIQGKTYTTPTDEANFARHWNVALKEARSPEGTELPVEF